MRVFLPIVLLFLAPSLWAGEYAILTTGFRLHAERHSTDGPTTTLYDRDGGYCTIPTSQIAGFEAEDFVPPPAEPKPESVRPADDLAALVQDAANRHGVRAALVHSVIAAESAYNRFAVSPKGALGLMQLMPRTAREVRVANPMDPAQNINGGTAYLRRLLDRYRGFGNQLERALAAYNAGPAKVDLYGGLPPYRDTVDFVFRVSARFARLMEQP